ncbi:MAG: hypothetical protein Q4F66_00705 [Clostridium sp.]|nr:hypothetical protein [Clostridium sp.]
MKKGLKKYISFVMAASLTAVLVPCSAQAAWKYSSSSGNWKYYDGGSYVQNQWIHSYDGNWYYIDVSGNMDHDGWMWQGYHLNHNGVWDDTANYLRQDVIKNGYVYCNSGNTLYEAGDPSNLSVINGEPCVFTMNGSDEDRYIGLNTLNVYDWYGNVVDSASV